MTDRDDTSVDSGLSDEFEARLAALTEELPKSVEPERDLWPDIQASIAQPSRTVINWRMMLGQAAAVLLLVGGSSAITWMAVKDDVSSRSLLADSTTVPLEVLPASFGSQYTLGPDFVDARRNLEGQLDRELDRLSSDAQADVRASMATIRQAIADINAALAEEPDNVMLQELLLSTYREELFLMRKVNGIATEVMRRDDI